MLDLAHPASTPVSDRRWSLQPGDVIAPGRTALELLGRGERYETFLAWDDRLFVPVVAKVLRPHLLGDIRARAAMAAEAEALEVLQHPVLVRGFGHALTAERPHLVLEFLDGPRLSTLIRKFGPLAAEQVVPLARQVLAALRYLEAEGWVHLDVKPQNLVMTSSPRLIDLSVARRAAAARRITRAVGTEAYMAPEQCDPDRFGTIGPAADIWGLGATLFEAVVGRRAFPPDGGARHPQLRIAPPAVPDKAPPALASAIRAALANDPADRPRAFELDALLEPLAEWSARGVRRVR